MYFLWFAWKQIVNISLSRYCLFLVKFRDLRVNDNKLNMKQVNVWRNNKLYSATKRKESRFKNVHSIYIQLYIFSNLFLENIHSEDFTVFCFFSQLLYCIVLYCINGMVIAALMHCDLFEIYYAPPNLGITRTWICRLNFAQRPIFSGLRFFKEPETSDSGPRN